MIFKLALVSLAFALATAAPAGDLVNNLPGLNFQPNFLHYSGYLQASPTHFWHYWFVAHQYATPNSPIILWLNGGPGCSSLLGLMEENGPFHGKDYGNTIYENNYAWNKVGHVIYMESPQTVGFSYTTDGNVTTDDDTTAQNNHDALVDFFTNKFPEYKSNNFYITGESYGGIYVPTLAVLVAADKTNFPNFKGIAVGNGILNDQFQVNSLPHFFYYHGIARQSFYEELSNTCCGGNPYTCDYWNLNDNTCVRLANQMLSQADDLDPYNIYNVCYLDTAMKRRIYEHMVKRRNKNGVTGPLTKQLGAALPQCAQQNNTVGYLNRQDVRTALHIPDNVPQWAECSDPLQYYGLYDNMASQILSLVQSNVRVLIYNGDVDTVCNVMQNEAFLNSLNLTIQGGNERAPWNYNGSLSQMQDCCDYISNVAGYVTKFGGIDFVTVRGSGHMVPEDKPREALQMIYNYINQLDYSTPVPVSTQPQPLVNNGTMIR